MNNHDRINHPQLQHSQSQHSQLQHPQPKRSLSLKMSENFYANPPFQSNPSTNLPFRTNSSKQPKHQSFRHPPTTSSSKSLSNNPSYECSHCPYSTDRKNNLKRHLATMHEASAKSLECCELRFVSKSSLRDHVNKCHAQGAGYACASCGRRFSRKALMRRHATVHNGERPHACPSCEYATSHRSNLDRHVRRHQLMEGSVRRRCCDQAYKVHNVEFTKRSNHHSGVVWGDEDPFERGSFVKQKIINDDNKLKSERTYPPVLVENAVLSDAFKIDKNLNNLKTVFDSEESDSVGNVPRMECNNSMFISEQSTRCDARDSLPIRRLGRANKYRNRSFHSGNANFQPQYYKGDTLEQDVVRQTKDINLMTSSCLSPFSFLYDSYLRYFIPPPACAWPLLPNVNPLFSVFDKRQLLEQTFHNISKNNMGLFSDYQQPSQESTKMEKRRVSVSDAQPDYLTSSDDDRVHRQYWQDGSQIENERNAATLSRLGKVGLVENNTTMRTSSEWNKNINNNSLVQQSDSVLINSVDDASVQNLNAEESTVTADTIIRSRPRMRLAPECHRCSVCSLAFRNQMESELHEERMHR